MSLKSFEEEIEGKKFKNPETKNKVFFKSLPLDVQKKLRGQYEKAKAKEEQKGGSRDKALKGILEATKKFNIDKNIIKETQGWNRWSDSVDKFMKGQISAVAEAFGLEGESFKGVENLSNEDITKIEKTISMMGKSLEDKYKDALYDMKWKVREEKKTLEEKHNMAEKINRELSSAESDLAEIEHKAPGSKKHKEMEARFAELDKRSTKLYEEISELEENAETFKYAEEEISSYHTTEGILEAVRGEGARRKSKEMKEKKERMEKEKKEREEKIKNQNEKLQDLQSKARSAKRPDDLLDLFSEFGRIKGQIAGSNFESEMKSEIKKTEDSLAEAQDATSLLGRFKKFVGLGKKASLSEDQIFRISCELAHERAYMESLKKTAREIIKNKSR